MSEKTAIIGIRVCPARKRELMEAAAKYKITLTDYIDTLIHLGLERVEQLRREKALNKEAKNGEAVKQRAGDGQEEGGN